MKSCIASSLRDRAVSSPAQTVHLRGLREKLSLRKGALLHFPLKRSSGAGEEAFITSFLVVRDRSSNDPKKKFASAAGAVRSVVRAFGAGRKGGRSTISPVSLSTSWTVTEIGQEPHQPDVSLCVSWRAFLRDEAQYTPEIGEGKRENFARSKVERGQQSALRRTRITSIRMLQSGSEQRSGQSPASCSNKVSKSSSRE
jgi:hypothetical protein